MGRCEGEGSPLVTTRARESRGNQNRCNAAHIISPVLQRGCGGEKQLPTTSPSHKASDTLLCTNKEPHALSAKSRAFREIPSVRVDPSSNSATRIATLAVSEQNSSGENQAPVVMPLIALLQEQMSTESALGNPDFMAGYALGMQQAHHQALNHVKKAGAMEMKLQVCQEEQRGLQQRARKTELTLAYSAGRFSSSIESLAKRLSSLEVIVQSDRYALHRYSRGRCTPYGEAKAATENGTSQMLLITCQQCWIDRLYLWRHHPGSHRYPGASLALTNSYTNTRTEL